MSILQLFAFPGCQGESVPIKEDTPNLDSVGFLMKAQSLRVSGDPWVVYNRIQYDIDGDFCFFQIGDHDLNPSWANKISSVRIVKNGFDNPKITLFDHVHYNGKSLNLERAAPALKAYGLDKKISSSKVHSGAWIFYAEENYKGQKMITLPGDELPDYSKMNWNDLMSSLRPLPF